MAITLCGVFRGTPLHLARYASFVTNANAGGQNVGFMSNKSTGNEYYADTPFLPISRTGAEYFSDVRQHQQFGYQTYWHRHKLFPAIRRSFDWFLVDCDGLDLYTAGALIARIVFGQHDPTYQFTGDNFPNVVVINTNRVVMPDNEWEYKAYWRWAKRDPYERTHLRRPKQIYQEDPSALVWLEMWKFLPAHRDYLARRRDQLWRRANVSRHVHMFADDEHPYEHFYPRDMTQRLLMAEGEVRPFRQYGVLPKKNASFVLHKYYKFFEMKYSGFQPPDAPSGGKWQLEGRKVGEATLSRSRHGRFGWGCA
eukprot:TRINITY_DN33888_c0_g1_i1.p1 TRINITY_DN33888_c0_g1~~TRINITY_DN33888_c0_g1_i1.p1  ORF type:complete len:310 (-),score=41.57 TRINITY_DN33888_c0_g1_i1:82-1011(-)